MKINFKRYNKNFSSGLTFKIQEAEKKINVDLAEKFFTENYCIETRFYENKSAALANQLCLKIFELLSKKLNINIALPPVIFLYAKNEIIDTQSAANFCIPDTINVLKNEYPFPGRSIFFRNFSSLEDINSTTETQFLYKESCSSHFLAPFIHEWIHSFHLDYIYKKYGYGGDCLYLKTLYPNKSKIQGVQLLKELETKTLSPNDNEIIFDILGRYSTRPTNQYLEIFSETLTKFICDSLLGGKLVKNPLEEFMKTKKEFKAIFKKVCMFQ